MTGILRAQIQKGHERKLLLEAAGQLDAAEIERASAATRRAELTASEAQILRLREHARALGAAGKAVVERLLKAEDRAESLRVAARRQLELIGGGVGVERLQVSRADHEMERGREVLGG